MTIRREIASGTIAADYDRLACFWPNRDDQYEFIPILTMAHFLTDFSAM
jgi:hypothetical protein